jgi:hypothetical protein
MKPIYISKTVWLNVIATLIAVIELVQPQFPAEYLPYFVAGVGILNVILRVWFTSEPISK